MDGLNGKIQKEKLLMKFSESNPKTITTYSYLSASDNFYYQEVEIVHLNDWLIGGLHYVT